MSTPTLATPDALHNPIIPGDRPMGRDADEATLLAPTATPRGLVRHPMTPLELFKTLLRDTIRHPPRRAYHNVSCLFICWEDDTIGCESEIKRLADVFGGKFKYKVLTCKIPTKVSEQDLCKTIQTAAKSAMGTDDLVLIYYGGHGGYDENQRAVWSCTENGPNLEWHRIQYWVEQQEWNTVFVLDCCYAASAARRGGSLGRKEMIGACGWEHRTECGVKSKTSYTAILIEEILKFRHPFTVLELHSNMMRRNDAKKLDSTPFYCLLSKDLDAPRTLGTWTHPISTDPLPVDHCRMTGSSVDHDESKKRPLKKQERSWWTRDWSLGWIEDSNISVTNNQNASSIFFGIISCALTFAILKVAYTLAS